MHALFRLRRGLIRRTLSWITVIRTVGGDQRRALSREDRSTVGIDRRDRQRFAAAGKGADCYGQPQD